MKEAIGSDEALFPNSRDLCSLMFMVLVCYEYHFSQNNNFLLLVTNGCCHW